MNIILRRNHVGDPFCNNLLSSLPDFTIINKDTTTVPEAEWVIRWGTTSNLPGNPKVINKAEAIHKVYNKGAFRRIIAAEGLAPKVWDDLVAFAKDQAYPVIVRPNNHIRSQDLYFCRDIAEVIEAVFKVREGGYYISEYVKKDSEYRVFIVSGRPVAVIKKIPRNAEDISWGCVRTGEFQYVDWSSWPIDVLKKSVLAFNLSGLDFGAVDVIVKDGIAYVLEINTAPEVTPYYGKCLSKAFRYLVDHDREVPQVTEWTSWKHYIHPAIGG